MYSNPPNILVVGPSWVGDMVMAQSLFKTLQRRFGQVQLDVVSPGWSLPLLARMPEVRRGIELPLGHGQLGLRTRYAVGRRLRAARYDQAIVLPRSFKAALVPFIAQVPQRVGYRGEMRYGVLNDLRRLDKRLLTQTIQRFVALGLAQGESLPTSLPRPRLQVDEANRDRIVKALGLSLHDPVIGLMPGAEYGPAKQWPLAYFAALAARLGEQDRQVWIFGSEKDAPAGEEIARRSRGAVLNLCGRTSLEDAIDLISLTQAVVTNDSGLMHVAAALNRPMVAIYGSSSPTFTPPLSDKARVAHLNLDCSPCFQRECPLGHLNCLRQLPAGDVYQMLVDVIGSRSPVVNPRI